MINIFKFRNFVVKFLKEHIYPIVMILLGIIDQNSNLLVQFIHELGAPDWCATLLRVIIITVGAFKLYYLKSPKK